MALPTITPLPTPPSRSDPPATFIDRADAWNGAIPNFSAEVQALAAALAVVGSAINYAGTSTTSTTIGTGSKTVTVEAGRAFQIGQFALVASAPSPSNYMFGQITAYNGTTGSLTVNVTATNGSGTFANWVVSLMPATNALPLSGGAMTGPLALAGDPSSALQAATKQYVDSGAAAALASAQTYSDNVAAGLDVKQSARFATAAALPTNTRTGNVLTASANGALAVDGGAPALNDRIVVKNETTAANNGIYTLTQVGTGSLPWKLTRSTDMDSWGEVPGANVWIEEGTANADRAFVCTSDQSGTLNTTAIVWALFGGAGAYQPSSSELSAIALLTTTSLGRSLLTIANAAAGRATLQTSELGGHSGLLLKNNSTTPNSKIDYSADSAVLVDANGGTIRHTGISGTIDASVNGAADRLDAGTLAATSHHYVHLISDGTSCKALMSLSATAPTLPSGYTYSLCVGSFPTNASSNFLTGMKRGDRFHFVVGSTGTLTDLPTAHSGAVGNTGVPTYVDTSLAAYLPPSALSVALVAMSTAGTNSVFGIAPNGNYGFPGGTTRSPPLSSQASVASNLSAELLLETPQHVWVSANGSTVSRIVGYRDKY